MCYHSETCALLQRRASSPALRTGQCGRGQEFSATDTASLSTASRDDHCLDIRILAQFGSPTVAATFGAKPVSMHRFVVPPTLTGMSVLSRRPNPAHRSLCQYPSDLGDDHDGDSHQSLNMPYLSVGDALPSVAVGP